MSSSDVQNSWSAKIAHFFRGIVVFLFLISLPLIAIYWDNMPLGVKTGLHWVRAQILHSDAQTEEPFQVTPDFETAEDAPSQRIFADTENRRVSAENNISLVPVQQVSHQQSTQTAIPVAQAFYQSEIPVQQNQIHNSEIQDLELKMQQLGASQCRLEPWDKEGRLYRFSCFATPCSGSHGFQKHFQQIAASPEGAMKQVHQQLIDWQTGINQK